MANIQELLRLIEDVDTLVTVFSGIKIGRGHFPVVKIGAFIQRRIRVRSTFDYNAQTRYSPLHLHLFANRISHCRSYGQKYDAEGF